MSDYIDEIAPFTSDDWERMRQIVLKNRIGHLGLNPAPIEAAAQFQASMRQLQEPLTLPENRAEATQQGDGMSLQRHRYHATGTCEFTPGSIKDAVDEMMKLIAEQIGHDVRLFNVITTTHPGSGNVMLITVIAEDLVPQMRQDVNTKAGEQ